MKLLDNYRKIKSLLVENGFPQLENVGILELTETERKSDECSGYCKCKLLQDKQYNVSDDKILIPVEAEYVKIRVKKDGEVLETSRVIPTLLHEFAHCLSLVERVKDSQGKWENKHHDEEFYNVFAELLKKSEELGIYKMTYTKGFKYSIPTLKRFDQIFLVDNDTVNTGYSDMFPDKKTKHIIRFSVMTPKGSKMVFWNKEAMDLYSLIKNKANIKKKEFTLIDEDGNEITRKDITDGCSIWVK